ncbi:DEAD/DEAH box helicase [Salipaludibacillus sp. CUR1]|uniref:DEAD/DEAH box helicase n=1 Tax=Salipaludibacillus sp. CUR1 TaxID=2820003 RepID=UPI001E5B0BC9|nr:DEAD/DEAH box helicase [Salipaludibacillus sp. CUR1]MCE7794235.1 DEAD/DEAH box helicase [Salipaludibacillus sp. CUR1]
MKHNFDRFQLKPFLIQTLEQQGISLPTEIQERLIPSIRNGQDVIGRSQTGTGKTLAFLLPILDRVETEKKSTQFVITAPTRELALQLYEVFKIYAEQSDDSITAQLVVGGTDRLRMIEKAQQQPHIVIGTPGRILDMLNEQALRPASVKAFVVDEADQMLDMGFLEEVDKIASRMSDELQLLVFSATIPEKLKPFLRKYMKNPKQVEVEAPGASPENIAHFLVPDRDRDRKDILLKITSSLQPFLAIVFVNTKETADEIHEVMRAEGMNVDCIHGDMPPRHRKKVLKKLQDAEIQYLVATDLIARGIDVKGVSHIINYEIPKELEYYVHRVGRTARAGWDGTAITIYGRSDQTSIEKLEKQGIAFEYKEVKKGEWVTVEKRNFQQRKTSSDQTVKTGNIKKPKKVKPGYKKKFKQKMEEQAKRQRRINRRKG